MTRQQVTYAVLLCVLKGSFLLGNGQVNALSVRNAACMSHNGLTRSETIELLLSMQTALTRLRRRLYSIFRGTC